MIGELNLDKHVLLSAQLFKKFNVWLKSLENLGPISWTDFSFSSLFCS